MISNNTGTTIEYRRDGAGSSFPIATGLIYTVEGITDASQVACAASTTATCR